LGESLKHVTSVAVTAAITFVFDGVVSLRESEYVGLLVFYYTPDTRC